MWHLSARFCPLCGLGLAEAWIEGRARMRCSGCEFVLFQNPASAAAGVVLDGPRVLLVRRLRDDRLYALKISSDPSHDARLADEALVLKSLPKHPRIVDLHTELTLKGRKCLLLSLAGAR